MKRFLFLFSQSIKNAPVFVLLFYYAFILLDLYTTWITSPDLALEWNFLVRTFQLGWVGVYIIAFGGAFFLSLGYIISIYYINNKIDWDQYRHSPFYQKIIQTKELLIPYLFLGYFYKHISYSVFVILNNFLAFIYLSKSVVFFKDIAQDYVKFQSVFNSYYFLFIKGIFLFIGYIYAAFKFKQIKYKTSSN